MTVLQITDKVRFITRLDTNDVSDAQLYRLLNDAVSEEMKFVTSMHEDFLLKQGTDINTVSGTSDYTLATDIIQLKKMTLSNDGTNYYVAYEKDLNDVTNLISTTESFSEPKYSKITQTSASEFIIRFYPTPTATVTAGIKYWYIQRPAALTLTTETPVIPPELHNVLVQRCIKELKQRDGDLAGVRISEDQIAIEEEKYKRGIAQRNIDTWEGFNQPVFTE